MKNILIIGVNEFAGRRILNNLSAEPIYNVAGYSLRDDICLGKGYHLVCVDIRGIDAVQRLLNEFQPDIVINTSAFSVPDHCKTHHAEAEATNVTAVETILHTCKQYGSHFVHLSTDSILDGKSNQLYKEEDEAFPINYYGATKLKAERMVVDCCSNYATVRVVAVHGEALTGQHGDVLRLVVDRLRREELIRVVSDQWCTPTFVGGIPEGVKKLMLHPFNGIYHICGNECLTIAGIVCRVADFLKLDRFLIEPAIIEEVQETVPCPRFSRLSIEEAKTGIGCNPHALEEDITASLF